MSGDSRYSDYRHSRGAHDRPAASRGTARPTGPRRRPLVVRPVPHTFRARRTGCTVCGAHATRATRPPPPSRGVPSGGPDS
ncbi:hypothetical protein ACFPM0_33370 [Pseudonocardia sulfidoxydans]|uniref:hypothetical protein n=1 Tax=Pseudonocardia sulfidoxydans TaxID=54011 RepID=UPI0036141501